MKAKATGTLGDPFQGLPTWFSLILPTFAGQHDTQQSSIAKAGPLRFTGMHHAIGLSATEDLTMIALRTLMVHVQLSDGCLG